MKNKTSFSSLPFEITHKIVINVLEGTKFDYLRRPNVRNFIEWAVPSLEYLYVYPIMPLRLVSKSFKEIVDSIIFKVLEIQHETPIITYLYLGACLMDSFGASTITSGDPFGIAGVAMDQFNDFYGIMSRDEPPYIFNSYYQFRLGRDVFRHVIHLFIYSCPVFRTNGRDGAFLSPSSKYLVPENFPKLRIVTLFLSNDRLSKNSTHALRKFFIYFRKPRNQQPIEINLNMKDNHNSRSRLPFALAKILEIKTLVVSLKIARCHSPLKELDNIWSFTNMKSLVIYDYGWDVRFIDTIVSQHKKIQQLKALETFEVYSQIFECDYLFPFTILPPTITHLTLHYDFLTSAIAEQCDTEKLCSGLSNLKYLHLYASGTRVLSQDCGYYSISLLKNYPTNFSFPKLISLKSTFKTEYTYMYAVLMDKIITPNKNTIKYLEWELDMYPLTMTFVESDLSEIEELSLCTQDNNEMMLNEYPLFMDVMKRMKNLERTFNLCWERFRVVQIYDQYSSKSHKFTQHNAATTEHLWPFPLYH